MADKIEPIKYADNIRGAYQDDDIEAVNKIEELYGDQEVTLKDLEEMFSYSISLLMTAYMEKDAVDDVKYNLLLETLVVSGIIDEEKENEIREEIENTTKGEE